MTIAEQVIAWSAGVIAVGGAFGILWKVFNPLVKKTKALMEALDRFTRDWAGEPAEAGRDAVPGVMERLNKIDGELKHNGGSTMKDAIKRIEQKLEKIDARLESGDKRMSNIEKRIN
jgi:hypothetical protein